MDLNVIGNDLEWQKVNMEVTDLRSLRLNIRCRLAFN